MPRKSIKVAEILFKVHVRVGLPDPVVSKVIEQLTPEQAYRKALIDLMSDVLHATDNYAGFSYVNPDGSPVFPYEPGETDQTRIRYVVLSRLHADYEAAQQASHSQVR